jgi:hypothetical protein
MIKKLPLLGIIALLLATCKKYEEGPLISLRTVKNRIYGKWKIEEYFINGVDSAFFFPGKLVFAAESKYDDVCQYQMGIYGDTRKWGLKNKKSEIIFEYHLPPGNRDYFPFHFLNNSCPPLWEIKKLKNKEMIFESVCDNVQYRIKLVAF